MKRSERLRQIGIGVQLRKLRKATGMSTRAVAAALGISPASINRNELGQRVPDREEVSAHCALYRITGQRKQELLEQVDQAANTEAWLESGHISDDLASLMVLERESATIANVEGTLIPGLAQTADYCRLVLGIDVADEEELERRLATRLGRQGVLSRPVPPRVTFLLDEGVLYRTLGDPGIMRAQLEHLTVLQRRPNVSIRVIPFDAPQPARICSFSLYTHADDRPYAFVEAPKLGVFVTEPAEVAPFVERYRMLNKCVLDEDASTALIRTIAERMHDE